MKIYCYCFLDGKWITEEHKVKNIAFGIGWKLVTKKGFLQSFEKLNEILDIQSNMFLFYSIKSLTDCQKEKLIKIWKKQWCESETIGIWLF